MIIERKEFLYVYVFLKDKNKRKKKIYKIQKFKII